MLQRYSSVTTALVMVDRAACMTIATVVDCANLAGADAWPN